MGQSTTIAWTDATWNPLRGCTEISPGCAHCYAAAIAARFSGPGKPFEGLAYRDANGKAHWTGKIATAPEKLREPLTWRKPRMVFVNSMSDLFHEDVPEEYIAAVFGIMGIASQHTFQVLTKRAARMADVLSRLTWDQCLSALSTTYPYGLTAAGAVPPWPLPNVWLGTSVENQKCADERIPHLLRTPARVRFLSCEPLLGPIDIERATPCGYYCDETSGHVDHSLRRLDWVIVGGESGPGARPCDLAWIRSIVRQCKTVGTACFVKQAGADVIDSGGGDGTFADLWPEGTSNIFFPGDDTYKVYLRDPKGGNPEEWPEDTRVREWPKLTGGGER